MSRSSHSPSSRILPWVTLLHALAFMAFWLTNSLFYASTNDYLVKMIGRKLDYVSLLLVISGLIAAWSCLHLVQGAPRAKHWLTTLESWLYSIVSLIYIIFFYGSFRLLFQESPIQPIRLRQMLVYCRFILDIVLIVAIALLITFRLRGALRKNRQNDGKMNWRSVILALLVFALFWSLPLIFPPASIVRQELPDKPQLVAHRGASMLAPENTFIAMQMAADLGIYGLETDIHISNDGGLFLMHDDTFKRTTDIQSVFPGRQNDRVENFTSAEVAHLNAGKWFLEQDPFGAIKRGLVTSDVAQAYEQQAVPTLAEMLEIVQRTRHVFIFDLKQPPADHPYAGSFFELCLDQIRQAGIDPQVWFLVNEDQLQTLRTQAPLMKATYGADFKSLPGAEELITKGYQVVNVEYGIDPEWIEEYRKAGLWVNLYTIDEPWQFSRLWKLGVDSITTSNAHVLAGLERPILGFSYELYIVVWSIIGLIGLVLIILAATLRA